MSQYAPLTSRTRSGSAPRARKLEQIIQQRRGALLVGLHGEPQPRPVAQRRLCEQRLEQIERQLEPLGFLRIEREGHLRFGRPALRAPAVAAAARA